MLGEDLQVWHVDGNLCFFSEVVREESDVWILPAEEIVDEHHCCFRIVAGEIGLVAGSWEWDHPAFRLAIPFEALDAAGFNGHVVGRQVEREIEKLRPVLRAGSRYLCIAGDRQSGVLQV